MSLITIEVEIDHGKILPREPAKLPTHGNGLLTILNETQDARALRRERIGLPLIQGELGELINPSRAELDASLWD